MNCRHPVQRLAIGGLVATIRAYQVAFAALMIGGCRHWPTCSQYAIEAVQAHGVRHGVALALSRLWRCRPGGTFGYDPVPHVDS